MFGGSNRKLGRSTSLLWNDIGLVKVTVTQIVPGITRQRIRHRSTLVYGFRIKEKQRKVKEKVGFQLSRFVDWKSSVCGGRIQTLALGRNIFLPWNNIRLVRVTVTQTALQST